MHGSISCLLCNKEMLATSFFLEFSVFLVREEICLVLCKLKPCINDCLNPCPVILVGCFDRDEKIILFETTSQKT